MVFVGLQMTPKVRAVKDTSGKHCNTDSAKAAYEPRALLDTS
jgi:hypothetical protein